MRKGQLFCLEEIMWQFGDAKSKEDSALVMVSKIVYLIKLSWRQNNANGPKGIEVMWSVFYSTLN